MKTRLMHSRPLKKTESISPLSVLTLLSEILENMEIFDNKENDEKKS